MYSSCLLLATRRCFISLLVLALFLYNPGAVAQQVEGIQCSNTAIRDDIKYNDCNTAAESLFERMRVIGGQKCLRAGDMVYDIGAHPPLSVEWGTCKMTSNPLGPFSMSSTIPMKPFIVKVLELVHYCVREQGLEGTYTSNHLVVHVASSNTRGTHSPGPSGIQEHQPSPQVHNTANSEGAAPLLPDVGNAVRQVLLRQWHGRPIFFREPLAGASPMPPQHMQLPAYFDSQATAHYLDTVRQAAHIQPLPSHLELYGTTPPATGANAPAALQHRLPGSATRNQLFGVHWPPVLATSPHVVPAVVHDSIKAPAIADDAAAASGPVVTADSAARPWTRSSKGTKVVAAQDPPWRRGFSKGTKVVAAEPRPRRSQGTKVVAADFPEPPRKPHRKGSNMGSAASRTPVRKNRRKGYPEQAAS